MNTPSSLADEVEIGPPAPRRKVPISTAALAVAVASVAAFWFGRMVMPYHHVAMSSHGACATPDQPAVSCPGSGAVDNQPSLSSGAEQFQLWREHNPDANKAQVAEHRLLSRRSRIED